MVDFEQVKGEVCLQLLLDFLVVALSVNDLHHLNELLCAGRKQVLREEEIVLDFMHSRSFVVVQSEFEELLPKVGRVERAVFLQILENGLLQDRGAAVFGALLLGEDEFPDFEDVHGD